MYVCTLFLSYLINCDFRVESYEGDVVWFDYVATNITWMYQHLNQILGNS